MHKRSEQPAPVSHRLWRLRRLNQQIDAQLCDYGESGADLLFVHNGGLLYTRRWPSRDEAVAAAAEKRVELERGGWTAHW